VLAVPENDERVRLAKRIVRGGLSVRAAERAAQAAGAKRKRRMSHIDPALASRVETAAARLTGMGARVTGGKLEIPFADETELEELAEALERLVDDLNS
jgi:hypothetical protein